MCDMDCGHCPHQTTGDTSSLDDNLIDNEGNEMIWLDKLQTELPDLQQVPLDESVVNEIISKQILTRLIEIMPEAIEIGKLREKGFTEERIAAEIGIGRKTYAYRIQKVKELLEKEFPNFL